MPLKILGACTALLWRRQDEPGCSSAASKDHCADSQHIALGTALRLPAHQAFARRCMSAWVHSPQLQTKFELGTKSKRHKRGMGTGPKTLSRLHPKCAKARIPNTFNRASIAASVSQMFGAKAVHAMPPLALEGKLYEAFAEEPRGSKAWMTAQQLSLTTCSLVY